MLNVTMKCVWLPCRLLENEIQQLQKENAAKEKQFYQQIEQLKKENNRQQKLIVKVCSIVVWCFLSTYGHLTFEAKIPASLQMSTNTPFSGDYAHVECITSNSDAVSVNPVLQSRHQCLSRALSHVTVDHQCVILDPSRDALCWKMKMKMDIR